MKFNLLDKIESLSPTRLVAVKYVSLAEEYLADHFPTFPVLPGVLMLEAATQAAAWVLHVNSGFAKSMAVLKEARNIKYGNFVAPGNFLKVDVQLEKETPGGRGGGAVFKALGTVGGATALQGRIEMAYFNLADTDPDLAKTDEQLRQHNRCRFGILQSGKTQQLEAMAYGNDTR